MASLQRADPELARLALELIADRGPGFKVESFCFKPQLELIRDPAHFKTGVCSRRSGKTVGCAADLTDTCLNFPGTVSLYITLSRLNAKRIIWGELLEINRVYKLGAVANETELCLVFPNRSKIYLSGAKDKTEIEKFRGLALKKVYIDEAQSFRSYLQPLIDEVLAKALYDLDGTLVLLGTPGPVPAGYFYEASHSKDWSHHGWTMAENPFLEQKSGKKPLELILADCKRMGVTLEDPRIQRECFGRWVVDTNSLVFRYSDKNHYDALPEALDQFVIGVDLGYSDADAIAVLGWSDKSPEVFLVEEVVAAKQGITELVGQLETLIKRYDPNAVVMDTGGLGKKIAEELIKRHGLPIKPAQKSEKFAHIELVNDALRTQRLLAKRHSQFAQDSFLVEWNRDKSNGDKLVVSDAFHSDICDAVLYAYRECLAWLHVAEKPKPTTALEKARAEAERLEAEAEKHCQRLESMRSDPFYVEWEEAV